MEYGWTWLQTWFENFSIFIGFKNPISPFTLTNVNLYLSVYPYKNPYFDETFPIFCLTRLQILQNRVGENNPICIPNRQCCVWVDFYFFGLGKELSKKIGKNLFRNAAGGDFVANCLILGYDEYWFPSSGHQKSSPLTLLVAVY